MADRIKQCEWIQPQGSGEGYLCCVRRDGHAGDHVNAFDDERGPWEPRKLDADRTVLAAAGRWPGVLGNVDGLPRARRMRRKEPPRG